VSVGRGGGAGGGERMESPVRKRGLFGKGNGLDR
jgi:hypothetical protein